MKTHLRELAATTCSTFAICIWALCGVNWLGVSLLAQTTTDQDVARPTPTEKQTDNTVSVYSSASPSDQVPSWTQFRGPEGSGVADDSLNLAAVGNPDKLRWRTPVPGTGWSSTVTDGTHLWMTTSIVTDATEEEKKAALANVNDPDTKNVAGSVELVAIALDAKTGKVLWEKSLEKVDDPSPIHSMNSYASPTPLVDGPHVVFHFGGYGTWCLDGKTGEIVWTQKLVVDDSVGPGSSPMRFKDNLIVACDGIDQQFVAAVSLKDGSVAWKTKRPKIRQSNPEFKKSYCTPLIIEVAGKPQAIIPGANWIIAYDPVTGAEIWRVDHGDGFSIAPMPLLVDGLVMFSTGYSRPDLVAIDPMGSGDVTDTHVKWRQKRGVPTRPSLISDAAGKLVYLIADSGILSACSIETGETLWRERIGGKFSASPLRAGDQILIANHDGDITVFATGDKYREIGSARIKEQVMASPIPLDGDVILRTKDAVYRYDTQPE